MSIEEITSLIARKIGLDPASVGPDTVAKAIRRCMADSSVSDPRAYLQGLEASDEEWQKLVDEVVVPETWFFRDWDPFAYLAQYVSSDWLPSHPDQVLCVLSVPCAAGQEAYSIAMALMDAGIRREKFRIDAVDISGAALEKSERGVYGLSSFRGERLDFRDRYFEEIDGEFTVAPKVREAVSFTPGNLLDEGFPIGRNPYDIIFCRNLLIYFDSTSRERAVKVLDRLLKEDGVLFAGHAETTYVIGPKFTRIDHPRSFAYRKARHATEPAAARPTFPSHKPRARRPEGRALKVVTPRSVERKGRGKGEPANVAAGPEVREQPPADESRALLQRASHLADEGALAEAEALCEELIRATGGSAECYCLLGLIHQASGDETSAEESFNKALYLDSDHYEALVHLMLMLEHRGDTQKADALRIRAERVQERSADKLA